MHKISIFTPAFNKTPSAEISISDFVTGIKYGKWKKEVEAVRTQPDADLRKKAKQKVSGVTISGTFIERKESNLTNHSGFICIDIDNYTNRICLTNDIYTYALFSSISNSGLAVIVKIDGTHHKESFRWIQDYYFKTYGIAIDPAPQNVASLRFVSYDTQCFINENSKKAKTISKPHKKINSFPTVLPQAKVGQMVADTVNRGINIAEDYHSYITLGFSLASGFGENGRSYFHALAGVSTKYNSELTDKQYNYCMRNPDGGITVGSFYWMLKNAGIEFPKDEKYENSIRIAAIAKKAGRKQEAVAQQLHEINGVNESDAAQIAKEVFERADISLTSIAADPEKLIESLVAWMGVNHPMKKNIITCKLENSKGEVTKEELNTIYLQARATFNTPNVTFDLIERIIFSNFTKQYHPIKEYIESNRHRNTTGNIDRLIQSFKTPTKFADFFIRKWLISLIAAIDGYPVRLVLALVGAQLTGKCLARGTKIIMHDLTVKNVEDIVVGDKLLGANGDTKNVESIVSGREKMYKINQKNGDSYCVNESHILSLQHRTNKKIVNVKVSDYIKWGNGKKTMYYGYKGKYKSNIDLKLPVDPYFMGIWLGDGRSDFIRCGVQIEQMENEIVSYLHEFAQKNGWFISKYENKKSKSSSYGIVGAIGQGRGNKKVREGNLKHILSSLGLNKNKHIPLIYQQASWEQRMYLLAGLIDTDGYIDKRTGSMGIIQVNKKLSEGILFLCRSLGLKCSMKTKIVNKNNYYRIHIGGNLKDIPCKIPHKKGFNYYTYDSTQTGISVEPIGIGDYYGFQINGDKLFMLGDFTVTHNTEAFRRLLPNKLKKYYGESKMESGKDDELLMTQKLIIMDDEMSGKNKTDEKRFKDLTSKDTFSLRAPYDKSNQDYKRLAVLCGTSNDREVINDPTGNTRILPVEILSIDHEMYNSVDKDELFMELVRVYESGENWNFSKQELDNLTEITNTFESIPYERELILKYFTRKEEAEGVGFTEEMSATDIKDYIELNTKQQIRSLKRLGMELHSIFGERKSVRKAGKVVNVYTVVKIQKNESIGVTQEKSFYETKNDWEF